MNFSFLTLRRFTFVLCLFMGGAFILSGQNAQAKGKRQYVFSAPQKRQGLEALRLSITQQKASLDKAPDVLPSPPQKGGMLSFRNSMDGLEDDIASEEAQAPFDQEYLQKIQKDATAQSYALKAAQKEKEAAAGEVDRSFSRLLPKIEGMASRDWVREDNSFFSDQKSRFFQEDKANISLSLPLITGGRILYGIKKARAARKATDASFMATYFALELEATQTYLSVIKDREIETSLRRAKQALSRTLYATKMRQQAGDASRTDIALAASALSAMEAEYYNAKMQRHSSESALQSLIQRRPKARLAKPHPISSFKISLQQARQLVLKRNPTVIMAFHKADVAQYNIGVERAVALPQLSLSGRYAIEKQAQDDKAYQDRFEKSYRLGFNLRVPLLDAESLMGVKVSRSRAAAQYYNALDTRRKILTQFERDWHSFKLYHAKKKALKNQVRALKNAIIGMEHEYKAGLRSITDILTYHVNKVRAEVVLSQAQFEAHILHQRILLATGKADLPVSAQGLPPALKEDAPHHQDISAGDFIIP